MKVAVLVIGELRNSEFVKNLYDGCDVFVHTDKKYGEPFPAKYQYFDENQERIVDKLINSLTHSEASIVVNNNAAAVLLMLNTISDGKL